MPKHGQQKAPRSTHAPRMLRLLDTYGMPSPENAVCCVFLNGVAALLICIIPRHVFCINWELIINFRQEYYFSYELMVRIVQASFPNLRQTLPRA